MNMYTCNWFHYINEKILQIVQNRKFIIYSAMHRIVMASIIYVYLYIYYTYKIIGYSTLSHLLFVLYICRPGIDALRSDFSSHFVKCKCLHENSLVLNLFQFGRGKCGTVLSAIDLVGKVLTRSRALHR